MQIHPLSLQKYHLDFQTIPWTKDVPLMKQDDFIGKLLSIVNMERDGTSSVVTVH